MSSVTRRHIKLIYHTRFRASDSKWLRLFVCSVVVLEYSSCAFKIYEFLAKVIYAGSKIHHVDGITIIFILTGL
ncbi:hypothetical protein SERLA73DRAFT_178749, partial [Serpula lacrymans var. lacrymans S7.3]